MKSTRWLLALALVGAMSAAYAQTGKWPERPVRIIIAAPPGGGDDFVTRLIAPKLSEQLGQQFIAENRPGAGGMIGQTAVMKSPPDGYTLLLAGGSMAGARFVNAAVTYDVLRDFTPVSHVEISPFFMLAHPSVPARNLKEYIALARSQPGKMTYATLGAGQIPYWAAIWFNSLARIQSVDIAYKSFAEATVDVISGRVDYIFAPSATYVANKARLRALAVTSANRATPFPDVPTIAETLPGFDMPGWRSIMGPAGMRRDIVAQLNTAIGRALAMPDIRDKMLTAGSEPTPSTPEELTKKYAEWIERFGKIAKDAGIKPQ